MTDSILEQKKKIEQKKARLQQQETLLKLKERKARVRNFINLGGLAAKAEIDHLPNEVFLGACMHIKDLIKKDASIIQAWEKTGKEIYDNETSNKIAIILLIDEKIEQKTRSLIRSYGLRWNTLRKEWYGYVSNVEKLKSDLAGIDFNIDIVE